MLSVQLPKSVNRLLPFHYAFSSVFLYWKTVFFWWRESKRAASRIEDLESSLNSFSQEVKSERRGRIRAQQVRVLSFPSVVSYLGFSTAIYSNCALFCT